MNLYDFVIPLGIATFALVAVTVVLGLFKRILPPKIRLKVHKICGFTVLGVAAIHGGLVIYFQFFAH